MLFILNILLFGLLIILLFKLLQIIFRERDHHLAFYTCLIFAVHPIHTEVIANVKSRDEIITFILLLISLINIIKHSEKHLTSHCLFRRRQYEEEPDFEIIDRDVHKWIIADIQREFR